jgi:hypothetical protein
MRRKLNEEIISACVEILRTVRRHPYGNHERPFITAYQIWFLLKEQRNQICQDIEKEYGTALGAHAGENKGPAQGIAKALGLTKNKNIETRYLDTRRAIFRNNIFGDIKPSGQDCGLFRLRD